MFRNTHRTIASTMTKMEYPDVEDGACHGINMMTIQAHLIDCIPEFNSRKRFIDQEDQHSNLARKILTTEERLQKRRERTRPGKKIAPTTSYEMALINLKYFFDSLAVHQDPMLIIEDGRNWNETVVAKVAQSKTLETLGGMQQIARWTGVYSQTETMQYFLALNNMAKSSKINFSIAMYSPNHSISFNYKVADKQWWMSDANQLPVRPCQPSQRSFLTLYETKPDRIIAINLMEFFHTAFGRQREGKHIIHSLFIVRGDHVIEGNRLFNLLNKSARFETLHALTPNKIHHRLETGEDLVYFAVCYNQAHFFKQLCAAQATLNNLYLGPLGHYTARVLAKLYKAQEIISILDDVEKNNHPKTKFRSVSVRR